LGDFGVANMLGAGGESDGCTTAGTSRVSTYDLVLAVILSARHRGVALAEPEDFEAKIIAPLRWDISKIPRLLNDPSVDASLAKVARFLRQAFFGDNQSRPKPEDFLSCDEIIMMEAALWPFAMAGAAAVKIAELPASTGYEPALTQLGVNQLLARAMAHLAASSGKRRAKEQQLRAQVVKTIKALPFASRECLLSYADYLHQIADESSIIDTICCEVDLREWDLLKPLRRIANDETRDCQDLIAVVAKLGPALRVPRGRKTNAASFAHQFLLESGLPEQLKCSALTYSAEAEDFTDPLTRATRVEFSDNDFDPRPARRRANSH
jgi:hypothetical protein